MGCALAFAFFPVLGDRADGNGGKNERCYEGKSDRALDFVAFLLFGRRILGRVDGGFGGVVVEDAVVELSGLHS